jgi:hypothetical protein
MALSYGQDKEIQQKDQEKGDQPRNPDPWTESEKLKLKPSKPAPEKSKKSGEKRPA